MNERNKILTLGAVLGAMVGLIVALAVAGTRQRHRAAGHPNRNIIGFRSAGDWLQFLVSAAVLLRQLADLLAPGPDR